jgi:hypothetical protein
MTTATLSSWRRHHDRLNAAVAHARLRRRTRNEPTPDTNPMFWETPDGWRGAYRGFAVGPYEDYAAACLALADCLRQTADRIAPMEAL